jgi:thioredoxin reductase
MATFEIDPGQLQESPPDSANGTYEVDPGQLSELPPPPGFSLPRGSSAPGSSTPLTAQALQQNMTSMEKVAGGYVEQPAQPTGWIPKLGLAAGTGVRIGGGLTALLPQAAEVVSAATGAGIPLAAANAALGAGITGGTDLLAQAIERMTGARQRFSGSEAGIAAGLGAVPLGRLAQLSGRPLARIGVRGLQGAGLSALGTEAQTMIDQGKWANTRDLLQSLALGGVFGAGGGAVESRVALGRMINPPIAPAATLRGPAGKVGYETPNVAIPGTPEAQDVVGPVVEQAKGGGEGAIKPGVQKVEEGETALGVKTGAGGQEPGAGGRNIPEREAEGGATGRKVPPEKAPVESKWAMREKDGIYQVYHKDRPNETPDLSTSDQAMAQQRLALRQSQEQPPAPKPSEQFMPGTLDIPEPGKPGQIVARGGNKYQALNVDGKLYWQALDRENRPVSGPFPDQIDNPKPWKDYTPEQLTLLKESINRTDSLQKQIERLQQAKKDPRKSYAQFAAEKEQVFLDLQDKLQEEFDYQHKLVRSTGQPYETLVVGGGAGGVAAGIHLGTEGADVGVIEPQRPGGASKVSGGIINASGTTTSQTGRERWDRKASLMRNSGAEVIRGAVKEGGITYDPKTDLTTVELEDGRKLQAHEVVGASGRRPRIYPELVDQNGNKPNQVLYGNSEKGNRLAEGGNVAFLGSANSTLQGVLSALANPKIKHIYIFVRSRIEGSTFQDSQIVHELAKGADSKISLVPGTLTKDRAGNVSGTLATDAKGNLDHIAMKDGTKLPVKAINVFQEQILNTELYPKQVLGPAGRNGALVNADEVLLQTQQPHLSVIGDIANVRRQPRIDTATGEGANVSGRIVNQLQEKQDLGRLDTLWRAAKQWRQSPQERLAQPASGPSPGTGLTAIPMPSVRTTNRLGGFGPAFSRQSQTGRTVPPLGAVRPKVDLPLPVVPAVGGEQPQQQPEPRGAYPRPPITERAEVPPPAPEPKPAAPGEPVLQRPGEVAASVSEANARVQENPRRADQLVSDLNSGERTALDQADESLLIQRRGDLQDARDKAGQRSMDKTLSDGERAEAGATFEDLDSQIRQMEDATGGGDVFKGRAQSQAWHAFKIRDYEYPAMEQKVSIAQNGEPLTPQQQRVLKTGTDRLAKALVDQEGITRRTGFVPGVLKPGDPNYDAIRHAQYEVHNAKTALDDEVFKTKIGSKGLPARAAHTAREITGVARAVMTGADFSAVRKQGGIFTVAHPILSAEAIPDMVKAARSDYDYFRLMQDIRERPNARAGFYNKMLTDVASPKLSEMEEMYMSRLANRIPVIAGSQRAYVYFLNRLRADVFDGMAATLGRSGQVTPVQADAISNFVSVFSGRGTIPAHYANAATLLNEVFFAPRWLVSRFQVLTGQPLRYSKDPAVTKLIAGEYARALGGYALMYGLAGMALKEFVTIESDPRSTDFGKIKINNTNTRIDPLSGLSQTVVFMSRLATRETKTAGGQIQPLYGPNRPYTQRSVSGIITDFGRSKLAPLPSTTWNMLEGKKVTGEPTTVPEEALGLITPMTLRDIYTSMKEFGVPEGAALGAVSMFGDSVQTYAPRAGKARTHKPHRSGGY